MQLLLLFHPFLQIQKQSCRYNLLSLKIQTLQSYLASVPFNAIYAFRDTLYIKFSYFKPLLIPTLLFFCLPNVGASSFSSCSLVLDSIKYMFLASIRHLINMKMKLIIIQKILLLSR
jgi:hypothetical protein